MIVNPFSSNIGYINDPDDFKMPYRLSGKTDTEVMFRRYQELNKSSYGFIVRLGSLLVR